MKLETKQIHLNGTKVRYLHGGRGKKLLFLHGWPANPRTYRKALELLANDFTVYAPFMLDMKCANVQEVSGRVKTLMKELGLANVAVVGTSFGGAIAGLLSLDDGLVSQLVLINTAGVPRQASLAKMHVNMVRSSTLMLLKGNVDHFFHRHMSSANLLASLLHANTRNLFREVRASAKTHACYLFQKITVPTTIIWCAKDNVFPVSSAAVLQQLIKNSKLVIVKADHYWPFHEPRHFAETVLASVK